MKRLERQAALPFAFFAGLWCHAPGARADSSADSNVERPSVTFLDFARAIPRSRSADREAPAFNLLVYPRNARTAAGEFAIVKVVLPALTLRTGFYGLLELEGEGKTDSVANLIPSGGRLLWRGSYGYYVASSLDDLARSTCTGCVFETSLMYRHESEHYTGSNSGDAGEDMRDRPQTGDAFVPDAAASFTFGEWLLWARVQMYWFLPERSSYSVAPGAGLHLRFLRFRWLHPFLSAFGEYRFGHEVQGWRFPDASLIRALLGVALPSDLGDVMVYLHGDVGHRRGIVALTEEAVLGFGFRLALGALPK